MGRVGHASDYWHAYIHIYLIRITWRSVHVRACSRFIHSALLFVVHSFFAPFFFLSIYVYACVYACVFVNYFFYIFDPSSCSNVSPHGCQIAIWSSSWPRLCRRSAKTKPPCSMLLPWNGPIWFLLMACYRAARPGWRATCLGVCGGKRNLFDHPRLHHFRPTHQKYKHDKYNYTLSNVFCPFIIGLLHRVRRRVAWTSENIVQKGR